MKYGLIGEKLGHSFSKDIHSKLCDYEYELCELSCEEFKEFAKSRNFSGINVTIPYKQKIIPFLDEISPEAERIGAVNTVVNKNGRLCGYNTDFYGLCALIQKNDIQLLGKTVAILGTGGTSLTAAAVAQHLGAGRIIKVSRTKAEGVITYDELYGIGDSIDAIINTTPVGMFPNIESCPVEPERFSRLSAVVDVIYNPLRTQLVLRAEKMGIKACGGLYMLVAQAVFAAEYFLGESLDTKIDRVYEELYCSKQNIALIGMPSSGKSTIGKAVAKELGFDFFDSDDEIVKTESRSISEIFSVDGESFFRKLETNAIASLSAKQHAVIATGGGAVLNETNIDNLRKNSVVVFIDRPLEQLISTADRPLSSTKEMLTQRYNERIELYRKYADIVLNVGGDVSENKSRLISAVRKEWEHK